MQPQKPKHQHTTRQAFKKTFAGNSPAYFLMRICTDEKCKWQETYDLVYELPNNIKE